MATSTSTCVTQMNFLVLEKVDAVTHGLINCGRRVANISFAIVWFAIPINMYNGVGIGLALFGAFVYMKAKQQAVARHVAAGKSPGGTRRQMLRSKLD